MNGRPHFQCVVSTFVYRAQFATGIRRKTMKRLAKVLLAVAVFLGLIAYCSTEVKAQLKVFTVVGGTVRDGGPATNAPLALPRFGAYDKTGNLYIADGFAHRIRRVDQNGVISTIAGNGISGFGGDGGPAKSALISFPRGITIDRNGNILFTDGGNYRVRRIDPQGIITTIAGNGTIGYTGDGGPAINASFSDLYGLAVDRNGNIYICDEG